MKTEAEQLARDCKMLRPFMIAQLPPGWTREVDQNYNICYYDQVNNETTYDHPNTIEYRKKFHKLYKMQQQPRAYSNPKATFRKHCFCYFAEQHTRTQPEPFRRSDRGSSEKTRQCVGCSP